MLWRSEGRSRFTYGRATPSSAFSSSPCSSSSVLFVSSSASALLLPATPRLDRCDDTDGEIQRGKRGRRGYRPAQWMTSWALSLSSVYSLSLALSLWIQTGYCAEIQHLHFIYSNSFLLIFITCCGFLLITVILFPCVFLSCVSTLNSRLSADSLLTLSCALSQKSDKRQRALTLQARTTGPLPVNNRIHDYLFVMHFTFATNLNALQGGASKRPDKATYYTIKSQVKAGSITIKQKIKASSTIVRLKAKSRNLDLRMTSLSSWRCSSCKS